MPVSAAPVRSSAMTATSSMDPAEHAPLPGAGQAGASHPGLVQTACGAGAARREDRADVGVAAPVRGRLGAGVGDSYRERLVAGLLDVEGAGQREPGGLVDPQLALGVGGAEVLLVAAGAGQDDLGAFGG